LPFLQGQPSGTETVSAMHSAPQASSLADNEWGRVAHEICLHLSLRRPTTGA
jgi:hypothetical protein